MRTLALYLPVACLMAFLLRPGLPVAAQDPMGGRLAGQNDRLELDIPKNKLQLGESITLQLVCHNTSRPESPTAAVPVGLSLELANEIPSSSVSIINGRRSSKYTFTLMLSADKVGEYELGPISVKAGGKTYTTGPYGITVEEADVSGSRGDRYIFGELEVDPREVYVTQTVTAKLTIGIREVVIDRRRYDFNLLRDVLDVRNSSLSVFANGDASRSTMTVADSQGRRNRYQVFTVTEQVRAEEVGTLTIGPIRLAANYPTSVRRDFFGYKVARSRPEFQLIPAIDVTVKGPPVAGRPRSFTGALGSYGLSGSAKPLRVEQGKPVTLTLVIRGEPLDGVAGPDLSGNAELVSRFEFTDDELVGDVQGRSKVFRRAIFPRQSGVQDIPAVEWSYFDPRREDYVTLSTAPIEITVDPPTGNSSPIEVSEGRSDSANGTALVRLEGGIAPNYVNGDDLLAAHGVTWTTAHWGTIAAPPLLWAVLGLFAWRRQKLAGNRGLARRRTAMRNAERLLREADQAGGTAQKLEAAGVVLKSYLADRFNLPPGELTPSDAYRLLETRGEKAIAGEVQAFLSIANAAAYAPVDASEFASEDAAAKVRRWMRALEKGKP